ncbi:hypothetical protein DL96DRAFT_570426 [Flagelloscypha sp. PMI_526]|nr:hypothetical protein DL96DRAFT_570426 [Flagelloscypha sp. PMI_526]
MSNTYKISDPIALDTYKISDPIALEAFPYLAKHGVNVRKKVVTPVKPFYQRWPLWQTALFTLGLMVGLAILDALLSMAAYAFAHSSLITGHDATSARVIDSKPVNEARGYTWAAVAGLVGGILLAFPSIAPLYFIPSERRMLKMGVVATVVAIHHIPSLAWGAAIFSLQKGTDFSVFIPSVAQASKGSGLVFLVEAILGLFTAIAFAMSRVGGGCCLM